MRRYQWPDTPDLLRPDDSAGRRLHNGRLRTVLEARAGAADAAAPVMRAAPPADDGPVWVPIGPTTMLNGSPTDYSRTDARVGARVGGRVRDVWVSPDGKRAYAAAAGGGVWYTGDRATTWRPLGGWAVTTLAHPERAAVRLSTGALHVVFGTADDGSGDVVAVGTGELAPYRLGIPGGELGGVGVLLGTGPANRALFGEFDNPWTRVASNLEGYGVYRIAQDPDDASRYVVASSLGLHSHSGASTEGETWPRVAVDPFDIGDGPNDYQVISDVVWVPRHDGDPPRLFVAWFGKGVWMSEHGTTGPFEKVSLPGSVTGRLGLAMAPSNPGTVYVLGQGPKLWRIRMTPDGPEADRIDHVPKNLFGEPPTDQSGYDLAIAVDPADSRRVVLGGAAAWAENGYQAALVRCRVSDDGGGPKLDWDPNNDAEDPTAKPSRTFKDDPTWVGLGVHADVHALRYAEGDPNHELWVACDGGLFRSRAVPGTRPGDPGTSAGERGTFVAVNTGLGVLQPGYVASHPVNDVSMAAGTQDNGTIVRVGVGTWAMYDRGDGGGVVFHPAVPDVLAHQYIRASWNSLARRWSNPVKRRSTITFKEPSEEAEDKASSFYSGVAVFRRPDGTVRLAVGTNRVWLSDNWNPAVEGVNSWVTLPHGTDPRAGNGDDISTDVQYDDSDGMVVALRWLSEKRLLVLMRRAVLVYRQTDDGKWLVDAISDRGTKSNSTVSDGSITSPSDYLPPVEGCEFSDIAVHDANANQGARGSFYVATTSARDFPHMDTLWWFDGGLKWYRTGLRDEGVPAPAYAVAVDHTPGGDTGVVYVGTGTGVWRGKYVPAGGADPPDWIWTRLDNGLPEAAVQDLTVERFGDRLLLRAAMQSRGVWELELQGPAAPKTYLQSAAFDGRRGASSSAATTFPYADPFTPQSSTGWFESPDVQVRTAPGVVPPKPVFPINESNWETSPQALWQFQVALHNVDPTCRPVGQWTASFGRSLKAYRKKHPVGANEVPDAQLQVIDEDVWGQVMVPGNVFAPMWDGLEATEADLLELVRRNRLSNGITRILPGLANVDVLVHHRDSRPVAASDVRVTLLRRAVTALPADWDALRLEAGACAALVGALTTNARPAMPAPWAYADPGTAVRHPNFDVDARSPRPVTFRIDAGALGARTLLLAAVSVGGPEVIATSAGRVRDLVRADHHLAARIIQAV